ncbi:MAG: PrsW family glutamic-type intramembrane protease [Patescibacteria group bacterium]
MNYLILIIFALAPSFIWLIFFLRKDAHPESNKMILRVFLYGMLVAIPALIIERGLFEGFKKIIEYPALISFLNIFLGVAFIEEFLKYFVFKKNLSGAPELDEPTDIMLYMIIAALGFAAFENLLILLPLRSYFLIQDVFFLSLLRFVGATFLHALASGLLGYFLALSFLKTKRRGILILTGLGTATLLHGLYNLSIIKMGEGLKEINGQMEIADYPLFITFAFLLAGILISLSLFVTLSFKKLKEIKSICEI